MVYRGHEVVLLTQEPEDVPAYHLDEKVLKRDTHVNCHMPIIRNVIRNCRLHKEIKKAKCDVAISFMTGMNLQAIMANFFTKTPLIVSERTDPKVYDKTLLGFFRTVLYPFASGFVFQTNEAQAYFSRRIRERSVVIPNPLFGGLAEKKSYEASKRIVAVGRLSSAKNYPFMLRCFSRFIHEFPDYTLEIYGNGSLETQLKEMSKEMGLADYVHFMGVCSDLPHKIESSDIFLMTSEHEGMSNALAEALAIGLPCISTDCSGGGAAYLIENGENGYLVSRGDDNALLEKLRTLAKDQQLRKSLGENAKKIIEHLNEQFVLDQWEKYLRGMIK